MSHYWALKFTQGDLQGLWAGIGWFGWDRPRHCAFTTALFRTRREAREAAAYMDMKPVKVWVDLKEGL